MESNKIKEYVMSLLLIKDTVQQVAKAITAALELETEIVDEHLCIIGGTGRYLEKIGLYEEEGDVDSQWAYARCLKNGEEYITFAPQSDAFYNAKENEKAEICCPVKIDNSTVGLIGLIAFNQEQRSRMIEKTTEFISFLRIMAELIAGKLVLSQNNMHLQNTISSILSSHTDSTSFENMISRSEAMEKVKKRALQVSQSNSTVLITGESGTGKDLLARSIHKESPRGDHPFISINCGAIPEMLLESELFGYERGAFTGAEKTGKIGKFKLADGGTIFLDEVGDMPLHLQVKLLTALQNRQIDPVGSTSAVDVDVRVIAATNKNLEELIQKKQFREDLYFRLNVIPIYIPPLRQRSEDIELLVNFALDKFSKIMNKPIVSIEVDAMKALLSYDWPGNVREIENVIEYAINMEEGISIEKSSLPDNVIFSRHIGFTGEGSLRDRLNAAEGVILENCLKERGTSLKAKRDIAKMLDVSESTLYRKLRKVSLLE